MRNLNETNRDVLNDPRIGNKFYTLIESYSLEGNIHRAVAESFMQQARIGTLNTLINNNLNFNQNGVYEIDYSYLNLLYTLMTGDITYLRFSFVVIDKSNFPLQLNPQISSENTLLYLAVSLQDDNHVTIGEHNYLVVNANLNEPINNLKITDSDFSNYQAFYQDSYLNVLNTYFSYNGVEGNTQYIDYHISDLEDILNNDYRDKYQIHLSEITNIEELVQSGNILINMNVYNRHFKDREKQLTLVFTSDDDFFDMGSLRP